MALSIAEMREATAFVDVYKVLGIKKYEGKLNVQFRLLVEKTLSEEAEEIAAQRELTPEEKGRATAKSVLDRVVSWDLLDKPVEQNGQLIPLDLDAVYGVVPMEILIDIGDAMSAHKRLTKKK